MFDLHVVKWAVFPTTTEEQVPARIAATGADGLGYLSWRETDVDRLERRCRQAGIDWISTGAGGAAGNTGHRDSSAMTDPSAHDAAVQAITDTCETVGEYVENVVITVGPTQLEYEEATQFRAIVEVLRAAADAANEANVTLQVEPLNTRVDHPGYFLSRIDRGVELVEAVDHPNVRLLFDLYHQQITEGDLLSRIETFQEYIGMYHLADVPGRHEPGTGELNWESIFRGIAQTGFDGSVGLEYVPKADPDGSVEAVLELRDRIDD